MTYAERGKWRAVGVAFQHKYYSNLFFYMLENQDASNLFLNLSGQLLGFLKLRLNH